MINNWINIDAYVLHISCFQIKHYVCNALDVVSYDFSGSLRILFGSHWLHKYTIHTTNGSEDKPINIQLYLRMVYFHELLWLQSHGRKIQNQTIYFKHKMWRKMTTGQCSTNYENRCHYHKISYYPRKEMNRSQLNNPIMNKSTFHNLR